MGDHSRQSDTSPRLWASSLSGPSLRRGFGPPGGIPPSPSMLYILSDILILYIVLYILYILSDILIWYTIWVFYFSLSFSSCNFSFSIRTFPWSWRMFSSWTQKKPGLRPLWDIAPSSSVSLLSPCLVQMIRIWIQKKVFILRQSYELGPKYHPLSLSLPGWGCRTESRLHFLGEMRWGTLTHCQSSCKMQHRSKSSREESWRQ